MQYIIRELISFLILTKLSINQDADETTAFSFPEGNFENL